MRSSDDDRVSSLSARLRSAALECSPDTDESLKVVWRRAERRPHRVVAAGIAAALIVVVAGAAVAWSGVGVSSDVVVGPAAPAPLDDPAVRSPAASDATLVMYRYPNLPPGAPTLRAVLHTPARTYYSGDLPDATTPDQVRFGRDAAWEYGYGDVWAVVDHADVAQPEATIQAILDQQVGGPPRQPEPLDDRSTEFNADVQAAARLTYLISTGVGTPAQVDTLVALLETLPNVRVSSVDGNGVIHAGHETLTYAPDTGKPIRWEWDGAPSATMEFVAVIGVDSSSVVDPIAARDAKPVTLPTTTLTVPGDLPVVEPDDQAVTTTSVVGS